MDYSNRKAYQREWMRNYRRRQGMTTKAEGSLLYKHYIDFKKGNIQAEELKNELILLNEEFSIPVIHK